MDRRTFLKGAAGTTIAAIGAPTIISSCVLSKKGRVAPSDRIVLGCIGLGGQGTYDMSAFIHQPDVQVVALCDVDDGVGDYDYLYQYPGSHSAGLKPAVKRAVEYYAAQNRPVKTSSFALYSDFRELLQRPDIDAVQVTTPDHWHGLISIAAAKAGKDVYCEKPLVNSIPEGRAVCNAVGRYGRILQTGSHERSNDSVRFAYELVKNGRIGKLHTIEVNMPNNDSQHNLLRNNTQPKPTMPVPKGFDYDMWLGPARWSPYTRERTHFWWRYILEYGGGEMTDRGAHILDLAQFINDADNTGPVEISGKGKSVGNGLYDCFIEYEFDCTYANGVHLIGGSKGERGLRLVGDEGWIFIYIHGGRLTAEPASILRDKIGSHEIHTRRSPGHHRDFLNSIKSRQKTIACEEIGHRTATLCHLLNISYLTGRTLQWDPVAEKITNDDGANRLLKKPMRAPWKIA
jgi:predicted dehydrogenase